MNREEYTRRVAAAGKRVGAANPVAGLLILGVDVVASLVRSALHCTAAIGVCSVAGLSVWFAPVLAVLSAQTLGRLYLYLRRGSRVRALELVAVALEAAKGPTAEDRR